AAVHSRWEGVGLLVDAVAGHPGRDGASRTLRGAVGDLDGVLPEALNLSDGGDESRLRRVHRVAVVIEQHCLLGAVVLAGDVDPGQRLAGVIAVGLQRVVEAAAACHRDGGVVQRRGAAVAAVIVWRARRRRARGGGRSVAAVGLWRNVVGRRRRLRRALVRLVGIAGQGGLGGGVGRRGGGGRAAARRGRSARCGLGALAGGFF